MSTLEVGKIVPATGTAVTLGDSGDTFTIPASATLDVNGIIDVTGATVTGLTTGKIGQVLQAQKTDTFTTSATVYTDITDLSISITPTATSSKILVMMSLNGNGKVAASGAAVRIMRDSTPIAVGDAAGDRLQGTSALYNTDVYASNAAVATWLDEPNTTSAVVYKIQGFCTYGTNTFYINRYNTDDDNVARVRSVSTITVMEVLA